MTTRREVVGFGLAVAAMAVAGGTTASGLGAGLRVSEFSRELARLEAASGGRLGVAVLEKAGGPSMVSGAVVGRRLGERFPMCSTFKVLAAGAVLRRVDEGKERLDRVVRFGRQDLLSYAPVTATRVDAGMTVGELCGAAVTLSDNTAANLLLASLGGPAGLTAFLRGIGDGETRLDRNEPGLNEALPGDARDTSTPEAMVGSLRALLLGGALSAGSAGQLTGCLVGCETGDKRLRAGLPAGWKVGDKTGTGGRGTANDVGILWPTGKAPVLVAAFLTGSKLEDAGRERTLAEVGKAIGQLLEG